MGENTGKRDGETGDGTAETTLEDGSTLPDEVVDEAVTLTRRARRAVDENEATAYRKARSELLEAHEFEARVREEKRDVLVCYPAEWIEDGTVRLDQIEDTGRGVERPLEGTGDPDDWETVEDENSRIVAAIEAEHGAVHGANARALVDFLGNHYAKSLEDITEDERAEFLEEYYPRNVWPTDDQKAVVEESVQLAVEYARSATGRGR